MKPFVTASLLLNILVLIPVCAGLLSGAAWANSAYGEASPARAILLAVYMAILLVSGVLLVFPSPAAVAPLLLVQVFYKAVTPFTVGTLMHPVVLSNMIIAAFHTITLVLIWQTVSRG